ncbi:MAG: glycosyltransferase family 4 protein [Armatimonadetes bacterium]|nr:glycosyltransferase family 4 protein [Armatimonadota bacterium]
MRRTVRSPEPALRVLVIGPIPPPIHGVSQATAWLLESPIVPRETLIHLDTSDRRTVENLGRLDLQNVLVGLRSVLRMAWLCARERPSLIYYTLSQNTLALLRDAALARVARLFRIDAVVQLAGSRYLDIAESEGVAGRLVRRALRRAALVLVLGQNQVQPVLGLTRHDRVGVAPIGLPPPTIETALEPHSDPCCFLYLGIVTLPKGVLVALEALAEAAGTRRGLRAVFAGPWSSLEERDLILGTVKSLGLSDCVDFPGVVVGDQKEALFREADVYLLPSFGEGQPLSIIEAMAHRIPVVSTRVGAVPDAVVDGETGILVEPGDSRALAAVIERLIDNPELRVQLGAAGRLRFLEHFTLARSHEILLDHFTRSAAASRQRNNRFPPGRGVD